MKSKHDSIIKEAFDLFDKVLIELQKRNELNQAPYHGSSSKYEYHDLRAIYATVVVFKALKKLEELCKAILEHIKGKSNV